MERFEGTATAIVADSTQWVAFRGITAYEGGTGITLSVTDGAGGKVIADLGLAAGELTGGFILPYPVECKGLTVTVAAGGGHYVVHYEKL